MKNPLMNNDAMFKNAVLYAEIMKPYTTKIADPTILMILIIRLPFLVDDFTVIDKRTKMEPTIPINSTYNIFFFSIELI